jgi:predicted permease
MINHELKGLGIELFILFLIYGLIFLLGLLVGFILEKMLGYEVRFVREFYYELDELGES